MQVVFLPMNIDFSVSFYVEHVTGLMFRKPASPQVNFWVFLNIFSQTIWLCIATVMVLLSLAFVWFAKVARTKQIPLFNGFCMVLFCLLQLGFEHQVQIWFA